MSKQKKGKRREQYNLSKQRLYEATGKTAYLTIGRWQPPHKGHGVLIRKTLDLANMNNGHAYAYIYSKPPSREDKWLKNLSKRDLNKEVINFKVKNPLNIGDRLYYLQKMFPQREGFSPDMFDFLLGERQSFVRHTPSHKDSRGTLVSPNRHGTMSLDLVEYLKKRKYAEVKIVVGSDRIKAFKKYNPNIDILQAGKNRNEVGEQKLDYSSDDSDDDAVGIISYKLIKKNKFNASILRRLERTLSDEELFDPQPREAVEISGTRMREYARTANTRKFVEGCAIGDMTYNDCLEMMQDVREGMDLELKLSPRKKHHIEIEPHDHSRGVITKSSGADKDTDFFRDREKFIIRGGQSKTRKRSQKLKRKLNKKSRRRGKTKSNIRRIIKFNKRTRRIRKPRKNRKYQ
jgi:nicotinic acid mononucleotide adenylyltransferase